MELLPEMPAGPSQVLVTFGIWLTGPAACSLLETCLYSFTCSFFLMQQNQICLRSRGQMLIATWDDDYPLLGET